MWYCGIRENFEFKTMKVRVGIIGGAGYTGGELIRLLIHHPYVSVSFINSRSNAGKPVHSVHHDLLGDSKLKFTSELSNDTVPMRPVVPSHQVAAPAPLFQSRLPTT